MKNDQKEPLESVHIYDDGFPLCSRTEPKGERWREGPMVRQHSLADCPDCLDRVWGVSPTHHST